MAEANKHWARWVAASINTYCKAVADELELPILIEGIDEREAEVIRAGDHVELRIYGPAVRRVGANEFNLQVEINLLFSSHIGGESKNPYDHVSHTGAFQEALLRPIGLFRFGIGDDDDGEQFGCLQTRQGRQEAVSIWHFGQIRNEERIRQSVVDGRFETYLTV